MTSFITLDTLMTKLLKKLILWGISCLLLLWLSFADSLDNFSIDIQDTFKVGESVDFTVSTMKDGEVYKEYTWMIFFWIYEWNDNMLDDDYYELPNWWRYQFEDTDQWKKTFSKWLKITKAWNYVLQIEALDWLKWEIKIIVEWDSPVGDTEPILVSYPINWWTETKPYLTMIWMCEKLKNSPIVVYLKDSIIGSGNTDAKWNFNVFIEGLTSWDNEIQAKIIDINWVVLWESPVILVKYQQNEDWVYNGIEILPSKNLKQWDNLIINVKTSDSVTSVKLIFSNWKEYTMDRVWQWLFSKTLTTTFFWEIDISVSLMDNSNEKIYENVDSINIKEDISIWNIQFTSTGVDWTQVIISWESVWNIAKYQISYGTWRDNLDSSEIVTSSTILIDNLKRDVSYYFQITPMDAESHSSWDPSDIVEYRSAIQPCVVKWIKVKKEKIWDNYYLVWSPVENAISYEVYRSDWADMTDARLVWNLTGTRFQYLFNPDAEKDEYAYYQVQANCPDWTSVIVDKAQKVKVWPVENLLLIIIISLFVYSLYRLNRISEDN